MMKEFTSCSKVWVRTGAKKEVLSLARVVERRGNDRLLIQWDTRGDKQEVRIEDTEWRDVAKSDSRRVSKGGSMPDNYQQLQNEAKKGLR